MTTSTIPQPLLAVFDHRHDASRAARALRARGVTVRLFVPGDRRSNGWHTLGQYAVGRALADVGIPDGPARFYEREFAAGCTIVLVLNPGGGNARSTLRHYGGCDLEELGGELSRAPLLEADRNLSAGLVDSRLTWSEVAGRYETLFDQRYGTGDASWDEYEPAYRFAWELAHNPGYRARQWADVAARVRRAWNRASGGLPWRQVEDGIADVWQDVLDDVGVSNDSVVR